ncbi:MAG TPA: hypothetical protein VFL47_14590, partial [Flavisolibacter sp.]|nr:hypothetical protein [Flavisolibacter sp.]
YQRTTVHADARYAGTNISPDIKTSLWWIQAGGTSFLTAGHLILFLGTYAGVGLYHFSDLPSSPGKSPVRFAWSVRAGTGFFITRRIALNVRGDAIFTTDPLSKEFSDPSAPEGHTGYNSFSQLSFLAGITYQFFQSAPKPRQ